MVAASDQKVGHMHKQLVKLSSAPPLAFSYLYVPLACPRFLKKPQGAGKPVPILMVEKCRLRHIGNSASEKGSSLAGSAGGGIESGNEGTDRAGLTDIYAAAHGVIGGASSSCFSLATDNWQGPSRNEYLVSRSQTGLCTLMDIAIRN